LTPTATKNADNSFSGSLAAKYAVSGLEGEATLNSNGTMALNLESADTITNGMKVILDCETPTPGKAGLLSVGKATVEYKSDTVNCKSSYDYYKGDAIVELATAYQSVTLGCSMDYSTTKSALTKLGAALQFVQPDFTVVAKCSDSVGKADGQVYTGSYYHKVSGDMQVGAELTKAMNKPDVSLAFGTAYKLDKDTSVKAKVDSDGILCASYKQKVSSMTTMTLASQIDTVNLADNKHKFGLVLNITP